MYKSLHKSYNERKRTNIQVTISRGWRISYYEREYTRNDIYLQLQMILPVAPNIFEYLLAVFIQRSYSEESHYLLKITLINH